MESALTLKGKIAFITGSTRGIGWATAQVFAQHGATVILNGHSQAELLEVRVNELKTRFDVEALGLLGDVSKAEQVKDFYQQIFKSFGKLDVLVNNAGILRDALLGMISAELLHNTIEVNTIGAILNLQEAARLMGRKKSGSIINVASIIGTKGNEGQAVYSASKAAIVGLTLSAAKELAKKNIRVNAVAPGLINTDMIKQLPGEKFDQLSQSIKLGRLGEAEDVANTILFLASDLSSYVTGQVIGVDGGMMV